MSFLVLRTGPLAFRFSGFFATDIAVVAVDRASASTTATAATATAAAAAIRSNQAIHFMLERIVTLIDSHW